MNGNQSFNQEDYNYMPINNNIYQQQVQNQPMQYTQTQPKKSKAIIIIPIVLILLLLFGFVIWKLLSKSFNNNNNIGDNSNINSSQEVNEYKNELVSSENNNTGLFPEDDIVFPLTLGTYYEGKQVKLIEVRIPVDSYISIAHYYADDNATQTSDVLGAGFSNTPLKLYDKEYSNKLYEHIIIETKGGYLTLEVVSHENAIETRKVKTNTDEINSVFGTDLNKDHKAYFIYRTTKIGGDSATIVYNVKDNYYVSLELKTDLIESIANDNITIESIANDNITIEEISNRMYDWIKPLI